MANICENTLHIYTEDEDNMNYITKFMLDRFSASVEQIDSNELECYFDSKWDFPEESMNDMYNNLPNKGDIDMVCLSIEWGNRYCEFNECDSDGWK